MNQATNYMRVTGPHRCIRCEGFECETSEELTAHLDSKHPGWMTEILRPEMCEQPTMNPNTTPEEMAKKLFEHLTVDCLCKDVAPPNANECRKCATEIITEFLPIAQRPLQQRVEELEKVLERLANSWHDADPARHSHFEMFERCSARDCVEARQALNPKEKK